MRNGAAHCDHCTGSTPHRSAFPWAWPARTLGRMTRHAASDRLNTALAHRRRIEREFEADRTKTFFAVSRFVRSILVALVTAFPAAAQSIPGAVLAKDEPHHHLAYEDTGIRVLRVRVPAHDTTLLHEHDPDYFWIALGASEVVNAKLGALDAIIRSADLSIHYSFGNFAHVARNPGALPFDNITVELLRTQTRVRNRCEQAVAGEPMSCPSATGKPQIGVTVHEAFETDQLRVNLVTIPPGAVRSGAVDGARPWIITLRSEDARLLHVDVRDASDATGAAWRDGVWRAPTNAGWSVRNDGSSPLSVIEVIPLRG